MYEITTKSLLKAVELIKELIAKAKHSIRIVVPYLTSSDITVLRWNFEKCNVQIN